METGLDPDIINKESYYKMITDACNEACRAYGVTMESFRASTGEKKATQTLRPRTKKTERAYTGGKPQRVNMRA